MSLLSSPVPEVIYTEAFAASIKQLLTFPKYYSEFGRFQFQLCILGFYGTHKISVCWCLPDP